MWDINWHWPWAFFLLPLPFLIFQIFPAKPQAQAALRVAHLTRWQKNDLSVQSFAMPINFSWLVAFLVWALLITALARPYRLGEIIEIPKSGRDLLLAVDLSPSMNIEDMSLNNRQQNRLVVAKKVISEFIDRRSGDRLGLVLFGDEAYWQAPLTFDRTTVKQLLLEAEIGLAGQKTAIGDAIGLAVKRLKEQKSDNRVIVLLTDGSNNAGELDPRKAAELAAQHRIRIYTIGLGADEMRVADFFGSRTIHPSADMDEDSLKEIAKRTGGNYFRAHNSEELQGIYALLDQLEPSEKDPEIFRPQQNLYHWPLALAFACSLFLALSQSTWRSRSVVGGKHG